MFKNPTTNSTTVHSAIQVKTLAVILEFSLSLIVKKSLGLINSASLSLNFLHSSSQHHHPGPDYYYILYYTELYIFLLLIVASKPVAQRILHNLSFFHAHNFCFVF